MAPSPAPPVFSTTGPTPETTEEPDMFAGLEVAPKITSITRSTTAPVGSLRELTPVVPSSTKSVKEPDLLDFSMDAEIVPIKTEKLIAPLSPLTQEMDPVFTGEVHHPNTGRIINTHLGHPHIGSFSHSKSAPILNLGNDHVTNQENGQAFGFIGAQDLKQQNGISTQNGYSLLHSKLPDLPSESSINHDSDPFAGLDVSVPPPSNEKSIISTILNVNNPCQNPGCSREAVSRGLCVIHLKGTTDFSFVSHSSSDTSSSFPFLDFNNVNSFPSSDPFPQNIFPSNELFPSNDTFPNSHPESSSSSIGNGGAFSFLLFL